MLRIHFTVEDLARTRIAESPWPLLETGFAVRRLLTRGRADGATAWRRRTLARLSHQSQMIFDLTPATGYTPCFLAADPGGSHEEQLERVRATPRRQIQDDMAYFAARHPVPDWARRLGDDPTTVQRVADALAHVHSIAVAPYWSQIQIRAAGDRMSRARQLLDGGIERLLSSLHPTRVRWAPPVLRVRTVSDIDGDLRLDGRGLLLVPSVLGSIAPSVAPDAEPQPFLTYPVDGSTGRVDSTPAPLAALLGRTRAAVLQAIVASPGRTTGELATMVGVSPASASEHATVLRTAGLIATIRHRGTALHTATGTGTTLLDNLGGPD